MKKERSAGHVRGKVVAVTGAIALGLSPLTVAVGRVPDIDLDPSGQTETATFALG